MWLCTLVHRYTGCMGVSSMRHYMSQNENSLLWIESPDELSRWCNHEIGSSQPVRYHSLIQRNAHTYTHTHILCISVCVCVCVCVRAFITLYSVYASGNNKDATPSPCTRCTRAYTPSERTHAAVKLYDDDKRRPSEPDKVPPGRRCAIR